MRIAPDLIPKINLDKKAVKIEGDEFLDRVQLGQVTELLNDCIGIMNLLAQPKHLPLIFHEDAAMSSDQHLSVN